jgi:polyhydroxybutyrate depolymerase
MLQIHGTADATIAYGGGTIGGNAYPSAATTVDDWITLNGCSNTPDGSVPPLNLTTIPGAETSVTRYTTGCAPGGHAELWTINGGGHIPVLTSNFAPKVIDFLFAHPKP